jgi:hypothetical protein
MSPWMAITRMKTTNETYGTEMARTHQRFKKEREAWTTGMFALGLSKLTQKEFWVEIETLDSTPDTRLRHIDQSEGHNMIEIINIEIVDWVEHVSSIMEVIKKKCARSYPDDYFLLVHARSGKLLDFDHVIKELKKIVSPFFEVWILARISENDMKVVRVAPAALPIDFKIRSELERTSRQPAFLQRGTRGAETEFRDLGPAYLPLP